MGNALEIEIVQHGIGAGEAAALFDQLACLSPFLGAIRFEDPRLPLMMAAPQRSGSFVSIPPRPGLLLLWESWLRHEVRPGTGRGERLSISFNFA